MVITIPEELITLDQKIKNYACRVTGNKIKTILDEIGIIFSEGEIPNILTLEKKEEFLKVGLESSNYFHTDDTDMKHKGKKHDENEMELQDNEFDMLFSTETGYEEPDKRIALTKEKKGELLLVLWFPGIPIHNNPAELALRELVVKRKISNGTRSEDRNAAWEDQMSLLDTCRKLGVCFFEHIRDIFSGRYAMPRLAYLISQNTSLKPTSYCAITL